MFRGVQLFHGGFKLFQPFFRNGMDRSNSLSTLADLIVIGSSTYILPSLTMIRHEAEKKACDILGFISSYPQKQDQNLKYHANLKIDSYNA